VDRAVFLKRTVEFIPGIGEGAEIVGEFAGPVGWLSKSGGSIE
jgi:hypothetical protein